MCKFKVTGKQITALKKKQMLHGHSTKVGRVVELAFGNLPQDDKDELTIDYLSGF